jgi:hypothetical protein
MFALASYAASPGGRRRLKQLRQRLDTPANREKAAQLKDRLMAAQRRRKG